MSEANISIIQKLYAAFNSGDIPTLLANMEPDAEWVDYGPPTVPYYGNFTGRITDFFKAIGDSTTGGHVTVERYIGSGDTVVAEGRYTATVRDTGARIDEPVAHIFVLRGGKVRSWRGYGDTSTVVAAHTGRSAAA